MRQRASTDRTWGGGEPSVCFGLRLGRGDGGTGVSEHDEEHDEDIWRL